MTSAPAVREVHTVPAATGCRVCGTQLVADSEICPGCASRARTRAIPLVLEQLDLEPASLPLLIFAGTELESRALTPVFPELKSVSLYRNYLPGHEMGVDARDLSRYPADAFAGHFSSLLFDYFPEHVHALTEAYRVIAPGGVFITHIAPYRLLDDDDSPPEVRGTALSEGLPDTHVGARWFLDAIAAAGLQPRWIQIIEESGPGRGTDWFIGRKPPSALTPERPGRAAEPPRPTVIRWSPGESPCRTLSCRLRPEFGFGHVEIAWSLPPLPDTVRFGSHVPLPSRSGRVLTVGPSSLFVSDDVGESWEEVPLAVENPIPLDGSFVLADGGALVQSRARGSSDDPGIDEDRFARIYAFDRDLRLRGDVHLGVIQWHGSGGIDEHGGTVIWAEYTPNPISWAPQTPEGETDRNHDSRVYRSVDGGLSWENVLTVPGAQVRHFHVVRADRFADGVWWASTGDRGAECRVFRSDDDGVSWAEVTGEPSSLPDNPYVRTWQVVHRYTDLVVGREHLIWGTDDDLGDANQVDDPEVPLGQRVGSRLCVARKDERIHPQVLGWIGNPVRSIVDVGPAWLLVTEAKRLTLPRPQLVLVGKQEPYPLQEIGTVDLFQGLGPFTRSCTSRVAVDGRFFSFRQGGAVFPTGPRVLRWDVHFR